MIVEDLLNKLTNHSIDFSLGDYDDIVQVEVADAIYFNIKEIYYLSEPNRVIIRLEEKAYDAKRTNK